MSATSFRSLILGAQSPLQVDAGGLVLGFFLLIIFLIILSSSIKVVKEWERAVILRLGRVIGTKGPGVVVILPIVDRRRIVDLRVLTMDVPKQRIITKDNVSVDVDAVVYFRVSDAVNAIVRVMDYITATSMLSQTTLRDVVGQSEFDELLTMREDINKRLQAILDESTEPWGIKVTNVSIRDVAIPESMQRAIAKQAEAEREKRSRIIIAEGELQAAEKMAEAAKFYAVNPQSMRLRELQTWTEVAREKNLVVVTEGSSSENLGALLGLLKRQLKE